MKIFGLLLKKELRGFGKGKGNVLASIISAVTILAIMAMFVYLFAALDSRFVTLGISSEVLSIFLFAVLVISVAFSISRAANIMFSKKDAAVILPLPLDPFVVVLAKATALLIYELGSVAAFALPILIAYGVIGHFGVAFYFKALLCVIVLALFVAAISAILAPLFDIVKRFLLKNGIVFFVVSLVFVGALFFAYKYVLDIIIGLIRDRRLQFIFNSSAVQTIRALSSWLVFSSSLSTFLAGTNYWRIFVCLFAAAALFACGYLLCVKLYGTVTTSRPTKTGKGKNTPRSAVGALVFKEVNELVRTPGYMFSYLSIALSLPALAYLTLAVLSEVVSQLLTDSFVAPFALMIVVMYSMVSNTFGGDVVSREGNKLSIVRTIPVSYKVQIGVKLALSLGIAALALVITIVAITATGLVGVVDGLMIFVVAALSTAASIVQMTLSDLGGADPDKNAAVSVIRSFIYSVVVGLLACVFAFVMRDVGADIIVYVLPLFVSALYFAFVLYRYMKNVKRRIASL